MILASINVSFPVFEIETAVSFLTPRTPTVFERMVLRLCAGYGAMPEIGGLTLAEIFEERLGVVDSHDLLGPSLDDLVYLGVVEPVTHGSLLETPLAQLTLTDQGHEFQQRNRIPGRLRTETVRHTLDPLENVARAGSRRTMNRSPGRLSVPEQILRPADCSGFVHEAVAQEPYRWKSAQTEIRHVVSRIIATYWIPHRLMIERAPDGTLKVSAPDSELVQRWLSLADPQSLWEWLLAPALLGGSGDGYAPTLADEHLRHAVPAPPKLAALRIVRKDEGGLGDGVVPTIVLSPDPISPQEGALACLPLPDGLPAGWRCLTLTGPEASPLATLEGMAPVVWGGEPRMVPMTITLDAVASRPIWEAVRLELDSACQASNDPAMAVQPVLWEGLGVTIDRWLTRVASQPLCLLLSEAERFAAALSARLPPTLWQPAFRQARQQAADRAVEGLGFGLEFPSVLALLTAAMQRLPENRAPLQRKLLERVDPVDDPAVLPSLREILDPTVVLPEPAVGDALLRHWADRALAGEDPDPLVPAAWAAPFQALRSAHRVLRNSLKEGVLEKAMNGHLDGCSLTAPALAALDSWGRTAAGLAEMRSGAEWWNGSAFQAFWEKTRRLNTLISEILAAPCPPRQRLVVFDTCALLNRPDMLRRMPAEDVPVVPKRVLDELDRLKQPGKAAEEEEIDRARFAREVIRELERLGGQVRYEAEALSLLPPDWEATPDNRILSVALRLRLSRLALVTSDINFRNKARAESLTALTPEEYLRPGASGRDGLGLPGKKGQRK